MTITHFGPQSCSAGLLKKYRTPLRPQRARMGDREYGTTTMSKKHLIGYKSPTQTAEPLDNYFDFDLDVRIAAEIPAGCTVPLSAHRSSLDQQLVTDRSHSADLADALTGICYSISGLTAFMIPGVNQSAFNSQWHLTPLTPETVDFCAVTAVNPPTCCPNGGGY